MQIKKKILRLIKKKWFPQALLICLALFFLGSGAFIIWISTLEMPNLNTFETRTVSQSTKIYDRTGKVLLYDIHQGVKRDSIPSSEMSQNIKKAVVAIEDAEFYEHHGIKPTAILRAFIVNIMSLQLSQGGSTITQQVVKNSLLTNERTITRKIKEWVLALKLERMMDKDSILTLYLNESPFGGNIYGIEEASQTFYGKKASELTIAESAYIASLLKAPTFFSPYGKNKDQLEARKNLVLDRMFQNKFITQEEYSAAKAEVVAFLPQEPTGIRAPHFVAYVTNLLEKKYGTEALQAGGLKVITTLDYGLQQKAEEIVKKFALENQKKFNAENAAMVAIDPTTGDILAMVGSRDYFDKKIDGNFNVTTALRQPGSAFKPIVYATAFNEGYQPETVLFDLPTEFSSECNPDGTPKHPDATCYKPSNYDDQFKGPLSLRRALAESRNIPSIETLYLAGIKSSIKTAQDLGITSLTNPDNYGLTLVLGGAEVSPLELTSAYGVFANNGVRNPYQSILEVKDHTGQTLEKEELHPSEVLPEQSALKISSILSDDDARSGTYGRHSVLYFEGRDVAAKTGTTNDYRDTWIVGYTPHLVVGAWAGNNDNRPMEKKVAGLVVAPMWSAFMNEALKQLPVENFKKPAFEDLSNLAPPMRGVWQGGQTYFVDKISGKVATDFTPPELREERAVPDIHSILYWIDKDDPTGGRPANPNDDPQFSHWEYAVRKWVSGQGIAEGGSIPTDTDPLHNPRFAPEVTITSPTQESVHQSRERIVVSVLHSGHFDLSKIDYFLNGTYLGSSTGEPYSFSFVPKDSQFAKGENTLKAVAYDAAQNKSETSVSFMIQ
ncbi:MAG: PBP1A family penicillin-binding protein [Candidatus Pacebacteria bacterium]|nr:PBP1A family penicillin-binding protein [Candidatus Paceibacterota bacterium]MDD5356833.1 PBP1A family penicillin-binding protein [Candidatus Paceibacterota bacterium]